MYFPEYTTFEQLAAGSTLVPVYRQLMGDTLTPVTAFQQLEEGPWSFLFESVVGGEKIGRFSFLGARPFLTVEAWDRKVLAKLRGQIVFEGNHPDPLAYLEELTRQYQAPQVTGLPRFTGGAVGFAGYDTVRYTENLPHCSVDDRLLPDLSFALYDHMIIFDHINKTIAVVAHAAIDSDNLQASYDHACRRVDELVARLEQPTQALPLKDVAAQGTITKSWKSNFAAGGYEAAVSKCQEYIQAGDAFQVVLSQRLEANTHAKP
ncbi:MAG TPA: anthranilate synthase component I, partial [Gemmatales bacterium]|nr:anthranilate synthase component I [Gemmatales bacterium]